MSSSSKFADEGEFGDSDEYGDHYWDADSPVSAFYGGGPVRLPAHNDELKRTFTAPPVVPKTQHLETMDGGIYDSLDGDNDPELIDSISLEFGFFGSGQTDAAKTPRSRPGSSQAQREEHNRRLHDNAYTTGRRPTSSSSALQTQPDSSRRRPSSSRYNTEQLYDTGPNDTTPVRSKEKAKQKKKSKHSTSASSASSSSGGQRRAFDEGVDEYSDEEFMKPAPRTPVHERGKSHFPRSNIRQSPDRGIEEAWSPASSAERKPSVPPLHHGKSPASSSSSKSSSSFKVSPFGGSGSTRGSLAARRGSVNSPNRNNYSPGGTPLSAAVGGYMRRPSSSRGSSSSGSQRTSREGSQRTSREGSPSTYDLTYGMQGLLKTRPSSSRGSTSSRGHSRERSREKSGPSSREREHASGGGGKKPSSRKPRVRSAAPAMYRDRPPSRQRPPPENMHLEWKEHGKKGGSNSTHGLAYGESWAADEGGLGRTTPYKQPNSTRQRPSSHNAERAAVDTGFLSQMQMRSNKKNKGSVGHNNTAIRSVVLDRNRGGSREDR